MRQDSRPPALAPVDRPVDDVPAHPWLEHHLGDRRGQEVVLGWLDVAEALGEHREGPVERSGDDDLEVDGGLGLGHRFSSGSGATSSLGLSFVSSVEGHEVGVAGPGIGCQ